jgi:hypothetical protein
VAHGAVINDGSAANFSAAFLALALVDAPLADVEGLADVDADGVGDVVAVPVWPAEGVADGLPEDVGAADDDGVGVGLGAGSEALGIGVGVGVGEDEKLLVGSVGRQAIPKDRFQHFSPPRRKAVVNLARPPVNTWRAAG